MKTSAMTHGIRASKLSREPVFWVRVSVRAKVSVGVRGRDLDIPTHHTMRCTSSQHREGTLKLTTFPTRGRVRVRVRLSHTRVVFCGTTPNLVVFCGPIPDMVIVDYNGIR